MKLVCCLLPCLAGCGVDEKEKPEAPDMTALVEAYATPTRAFDAQAAADVQSLLETKIAKLVDVEKLGDRLDEALQAFAEDNTMSFAPGAQPVVLEGEGFARITRICTGHGSPTPPIDEAANGALRLTVGYTQDGLDAVIHGTAEGCAEQIGGARFVVDGAVNLYVGDNLKLGDLPASPILFQLAGFALTVDDQRVLDGGFDFQVCRGAVSHCRSGFIEVLLALPSQETLVVFFDPATKTGGFRGANGIWTCAFVDGRCQDEAGNVVMTPVYSL